jgi:hypothetical protein
MGLIHKIISLLEGIEPKHDLKLKLDLLKDYNMVGFYMLHIIFAHCAKKLEKKTAYLLKVKNHQGIKEQKE